MGIELQRQPQGHQRVGAAHAQAGKSDGSSQPAGALGFAALIGLMAGESADSTTTLDASATPLPPGVPDNSLLPSDPNAPLTDLPPANLTWLAQRALTSLSASSDVSSIQTSGNGTNSTGNGPGQTPVVQAQLTTLVNALATPGSENDLAVSLVGSAPGLSTGASADPLGRGIGLPVGQPPGLGVADGPAPAQAAWPSVPVLPAVSVSAVQGPAVSGPAVLDVQVDNPISTTPLVQVDPSVAATPGEQVAQTAPARAGASGAAQQATLAGQMRQDSSDLAMSATGPAGFGAANAAATSLLPTIQEAGIRQTERPAKNLSNRFGLGGEGGYGQPTATSPLVDARFQVAPTSPADASTVVAETISYWASQGVQSASLQLDGFGTEPVEVRISVNGDMAQVDFKTNQPEVRQAIEGAAAQLKDLLSSQGMQLAGLSIGGAGQEAASQDKYPRPNAGVRKLSVVKSEVVEPARVRGANPSVGQSLDLFV